MHTEQFKLALLRSGKKSSIGRDDRRSYTTLNLSPATQELCVAEENSKNMPRTNEDISFREAIIWGSV